MHRLQLDGPATRWTEALPVGNGRQGAFVLGGTTRERLLLNDATAWSGSPLSEDLAPLPTPAEAARALAEAREAVAQGRGHAATAALQRLQHRHSQSFVPFAEVLLLHGPQDGTGPGDGGTCTRVLDLRDGVHTTTATTTAEVGGATTTTRTWAARAHEVVVVEVEHDRPTRLEVRTTSPLRVLEERPWGPGGTGLLLQLPSDVFPPHEHAEEPVSWDPAPGAALRGAVVVSLQHDGASRGALAADGVRRARVVIGTGTTFAGLGRVPSADPEVAWSLAAARVDRAVAAGGLVLTEHLRDQREPYDRCGLDAPDPGATHRELLRRVQDGGPLHPALVALQFNLGRYLLLASSRSGGPPANLQGIWNAELRPPWSSNYTTNINVEMNYWPAEVTQLSETAEPLFDLVDALADRGRRTARLLYDCDGWAAHHNTDPWAYALPVGHGTADPKWAAWPMAGPWLCRHLVDHLDFGAEPDPVRFARERVLPALRGTAAFLLDWLRTGPDGLLGTSPSTSPENTFLDADGLVAAATRSATLDTTLARDALGSFLRVAALAGSREPLAARAAAALEALPPALPVAADGRVQEWPGGPTEADPLHRHQSHLLAAYPGGLDLTPEQAAAVSASLDARGDESTGWSLAWRIALRARLRQPEAVSRLLALYFRDADVDRGPFSGGVFSTLLSSHPPFQADANFGFTAAVAECLLQSHRGEVELLPCLPAELEDGEVHGLVARPGLLVDVRWRGRRLERAALRTRPGTAAARHRVRWGALTAEVEVGPEAVEVTPDLLG